MNSDDFSFTNWGRSSKADENVTAQTLIDIFGHESVCMPGPEAQCLLRPITIQKLEEWNNALSGGRCEGLSTLSTRFYLKMDHPSSFQSGAQRVSQLSKSSTALQQSVVYWWATQFLTEVIDRASVSRTKSPLQLVDELIQGLANGLGYTLGLYDKSSGHSVTPFAVTHRNGSFVVHVYDNNFPKKRREITVDTVSNTWMYKNAIVGPDGSGTDWSGGTGTFELTPMSARQGPFECSFCNTVQPTSTRISITSRDPQAPGYILITTDKGKTFSSSPSGISSTIAGASYVVGKGASGSLLTIDLPARIGNFNVHVRRASSVIPAGDVVVGMQRTGSASIQVSGNLAQFVISDSRSNELLTVTQSDTTITAPSESRARVSVASDSHISRIALDAGTSFIVKKIAKEHIEVSLKGANGELLGTAPLNAQTLKTTSEIRLAASHGTISQIPVTVEPIQVTPRKEHSFVPQNISVTTSTVPTSIVVALPD